MKVRYFLLVGLMLVGGMGVGYGYRIARDAKNFLTKLTLLENRIAQKRGLLYERTLEATKSISKNYGLKAEINPETGAIFDVTPLLGEKFEIDDSEVNRIIEGRSETTEFQQDTLFEPPEGKVGFHMDKKGNAFSSTRAPRRQSNLSIMNETITKMFERRHFKMPEEMIFQLKREHYRLKKDVLGLLGELSKLTDEFDKTMMSAAERLISREAFERHENIKKLNIPVPTESLDLLNRRYLLDPLKNLEGKQTATIGELRDVYYMIPIKYAYILSRIKFHDRKQGTNYGTNLDKINQGHKTAWTKWAEGKNGQQKREDFIKQAYYPLEITFADKLEKSLFAAKLGALSKALKEDGILLERNERGKLTFGMIESTK